MSEQTPTPQETYPNRIPNFGVIFTYGLYSVPAYDDPSLDPERSVVSGSELYLRRLTDVSSHPISGAIQTQEYHMKTFDCENYFDFQYDLEIDEKKIERWFELIKDTATFAVIPAKHQDGFRMWKDWGESESDSEDENPSDSDEDNPKILEIFKKMCEKYSLKFGLFYSWGEFNSKFGERDYLLEVKNDMNELVEKYSPNIIFFDYDWIIHSKLEQMVVDNVCKMLKEKNIEFSDAIGHKKEKDNDKEYLGLASFQTFFDEPPEEKDIPTSVRWKFITTIGLSYGYNQEQKAENYKSGKQLFNMFKRIHKFKGEFTLNLGPKFNCDLDKHEVKRFLDFKERVHSFMKDSQKAVRDSQSIVVP
jgi:alpha-L-fucosidase